MVLNLRFFIFVIFALSGFSGLIYQSIWTHYLKLFLGHAAYAQTLVLMIFMGGMAIGAWGASRYGERITNLLLGYAIVEGIIGLMAILFHSIYVGATDFAYFTIIPSLGSSGSISIFKWSLAAALILPQSILLGATFPFMSAGVIRLWPDEPGKTLAILYFTNSLGAAIGVLVSGFYLIGEVGLPGTVFFAGIINIVIAVVVWLLSRGKKVADGKTANYLPSEESIRLRQPAILTAFLFCSGFTGMASFMYEIGWIRMLTLVLGAATHSFELMLSAFILGLAIGGFWIKGRIDSINNPIAMLGIIQLLMATMALLTLPLYGITFDLMSQIVHGLARNDAGYLMYNLLSHLICMAVMLPTTIFAGMTLPLLTHYLFTNGYGEASIGRVYATNTIGAIAGVIVSVWVVMPLLGLKYVVFGGVVIDTLLGLAFLWHAYKKSDRHRFIAVATTSVVVLTIFATTTKFDPIKMASGVFMHGGTGNHDNSKVIFHQDGKTASVDLVELGDSILSLRTNGKPDASIGYFKISPDEPTMTLTAALPLAIHPNAKKVAVIGMGSGITTNTLLNDPTIESVDTIEIEPAILEGAKGFAERTKKAFSDPRSHIHIEDAKTYFTGHKKKYDLIISEPSNPWVSGVSGLFSTEFYGLTKRYLKEDGFLVQWIHLYKIDMPLVASVIKAISGHFSDYSIYFTTSHDIIIVASEKGKVPLPTNEIFIYPQMKKDLAYIGINNRSDFLFRKIGSKSTLDAFSRTFPVAANSDFFPVLDLGATRSRFLGRSSSTLVDLRKAPVPVMETLEKETPLLKTPLYGDNNFYSVGDSTKQAVIAQKLFNGKELKTSTSAQPEERNLYKAAITVSDNSNCSPIYMESFWLPDLHTFSRNITPYLGVEDVATIFSAVKDNDCLQAAPEVVRDWVYLYSAVGARKFPEALLLANKLLPNDGVIEPTSDNNYLMTVALLSYIESGENKSAQALWRRYRVMTSLPLELRLLSAVATDNATKEKKGPKETTKR